MKCYIENILESYKFGHICNEQSGLVDNNISRYVIQLDNTSREAPDMRVNSAVGYNTKYTLPKPLMFFYKFDDHTLYSNFHINQYNEYIPINIENLYDYLKKILL